MPNVSALVPWRVKHFLAMNFPLAFHLVVNRGRNPNNVVRAASREYLQSVWDDPQDDWPTFNRLLLEIAKPSDQIIDLGSFTGHMLRFLQTQGYPNLYAIDADKTVVSMLNEIGIPGTVAMLPTIPLPDQSCDFVIASQVLEHIIQRRKFMREIQRVLRPGGRVAVFVPDRCLSPLDTRSHVAVYDERKLRRLLGAFFTIEDCRSLHDERHPMPVLFVLAARRPA